MILKLNTWRNEPNSRIIIFRTKTTSWSGHQGSRLPTKLRNSIISSGVPQPLRGRSPKFMFIMRPPYLTLGVHQFSKFQKSRISVWLLYSGFKIILEWQNSEAHGKPSIRYWKGSLSISGLQILFHKISESKIKLFSKQVHLNFNHRQPRSKLLHTTMRITAKKGKCVMTRSVEDIVFSTEMSALDFQPSREEESLLQLIGLDRFITWVTSEILNIQVL